MYIKTKRLIITKFDIKMAKSVHENSLDEDNKKFVSDEVFKTLEEAKSAIDFLISRYDSIDGPFVYPILLNNKFQINIGHIQIAKIEDGWEVGYHIAKKYTGNGYCTEVLNSFIPVIMKKMNIDNLYGICDNKNIASKKVLEKTGFKLIYEGISNYLGEKKVISKYKYC